MGNWDDYRRAEQEEKATGKMRCVIVDVEDTVSKSSGNPMIVVTVRPSGSNFKVKNYIVKNEYFNRNMTQFFDAFPEIGDGNFNFLEWVGAEGAADFVVDDDDYLKVKRFISADRAADLPPFVGNKPERQTFTTIAPEDDDDDLPFDI